MFTIIRCSSHNYNLYITTGLIEKKEEERVRKNNSKNQKKSITISRYKREKETKEVARGKSLMELSLIYEVKWGILF